jgi:uncharacterized protein (TIGR01319 family)
VSAICCLDVGSTWTKGTLVSATGAVLGTAAHPTTVPEVLGGIDKVRAALAATDAEPLVCSSAGGGLRLAVVGQERLISAEAGYRVALSSGAKVVHISAGELDAAGIRALRAARPDVVLLAGGTDGGDQKVLLHNAKRIASARLRPPVVLAGNVVARPAALAELAATGRTVVVADNVVPDVGEIAAESARLAIREVFLRHVIGGKGLSRGTRFRRLVRAVTPDAVLAGVSTLAEVRSAADDAASVLVVDVGGATTDVYSAVSTSDAEGGEHAVAMPADRRTVEGDIGMRAGARGVVEEAVAERLVEPAEVPALTAIADRRVSDVDWVPVEVAERAQDARLAAIATVIAVRRHLRLVGSVGRKGAGLLVLSGGVFRHASPAALSVVDNAIAADPLLRPVLGKARRVVDTDHVLAPAGLLAEAGQTAAARTLVADL